VITKQPTAAIAIPALIRVLFMPSKL
jgi:hypothetical protein